MNIRQRFREQWHWLLWLIFFFFGEIVIDSSNETFSVNAL
jgi:hypothetical protein